MKPLPEINKLKFYKSHIAIDELKLIRKLVFGKFIHPRLVSKRV